MKTRTRIAAIALTGAALATAGASAAFAGQTPGPYPTDPYPTVTATQPVPIPTPPVVNQLARCRFTLTQELTFAPQLGRFVRENVPSITCFTRGGGVQVYTLSGPGAF